MIGNYSNVNRIVTQFGNIALTFKCNPTDLKGRVVLSSYETIQPNNAIVLLTKQIQSKKLSVIGR